MASRLSEESLSTIYNSGCGGFNLAYKPLDFQGFLEKVDFDQLLASPDAPQLIRLIEPQRLYYGLIEKGPSECLEVLAHISKEQFLRIFDYDVWHQDELVPQKALYWLNLLQKVSPKLVFSQFTELEEEYQIGILAPYVKIYDLDAYEQMSDVEQDSLQRFPGESFFYSIMTEDPEVKEGIIGLLGSLQSYDMNYALSILAHAAYMPPQEPAFLLAQFRKARLEEDGFISYEESLAYFTEIDPKPIKARWQKEASQETNAAVPATKVENQNLFIDQILAYLAQTQAWNIEQEEQIKNNLLCLMNASISASQLELDNLPVLKILFTNIKAVCSLGLNYLSDGDLQLAAKILFNEYSKTYFQVGLSLIRPYQKKFVMMAVDRKLPGAQQLRQSFIQQKYGLIIDWFDKHFREILGFEESEMVKGLFNRFPLYPKSTRDAEHIGRLLFQPIASLEDLKIIEDIIHRTEQCLQQKNH